MMIRSMFLIFNFFVSVCCFGFQDFKRTARRAESLEEKLVMESFDCRYSFKKKKNSIFFVVDLFIFNYSIFVSRSLYSTRFFFIFVSLLTLFLCVVVTPAVARASIPTQRVCCLRIDGLARPEPVVPERQPP